MEEPVEKLRKIFFERKLKNPAYSMRAFAKHLGISAGRLSEILARKRLMTAKMASRVLEELCLPIAERQHFINSVTSLRRKIAPVPAPSYTPISEDAFKVVADWYHFAILSLMMTRSFKNDPKWIGARLGISAIEARDALERLMRVGLIVEKRGQLVRTQLNLSTSHDIPSAALRISHKQSIEQAIAALSDVPVEKRDITSITMAIDPMRLGEAKKKIKEFRRQLCDYLEQGNKSEVFTLNVQLFPNSKVKV